MRFGIQLLNSDASLNQFKKFSQLKVIQGENFDLMFQLMDLDQAIRYMPATGATVLVEIARLSEAYSTNMNLRDVRDYSIRRNATAPFSQDRSIWKLPLLPDDTSTLMSSNIRVTLNEAGVIKIGFFPMAFEVQRSETT